LTARLCVAFFASGASALLLETLWFRQVGLLVGNSVWASSLVMSSFMAGLGLGNAGAARLGRITRRPIIAYALLELAIGATGVGLVLALPALPERLGPMFSRFATSPLLLNVARSGLAFLLLIVPAAAMGATLPLLTRALYAGDRNFGRVLGRLYGWNTLGGVLGALAGEAWLVERLGLRGTAWVAGALNLVAATIAVGSGTRTADPPRRDESGSAQRPAAALLLAAFLCGGIVLALELLWFRLLLLFVYGTSLAFSVMLAAVLLGVASGGLLGGRLLRHVARPRAALPGLALLAGTATAWTYATLPDVVAGGQGRPLASVLEVAGPALALMLPTCLVSGLLFTFLGAALKGDGGEAAQVSGTLTLANTVGAMAGAPLAGFVLLPRFGVEVGILGLASAFGLVALVTLADSGLVHQGPRVRVASLTSLVAFCVAVGLFPRGLMEKRYLRTALERWTVDGSRLVAWREGVTESIAYLARRAFGETVSVRLVTNGFSMSSSEVSGQRYMKLFVYWPVAIRPDPRRALLISYGVGMTARALADTRSLERIDVVDISRDILEMGRHAFPEGGFPLADPRVRVHVEDGRFFLLTSEEKWDVITSEPPPPRNAGIVSLYTREYFSLVREHLAQGGVATYWLPVYQLTWDESRAVARSFCDAFSDCSLWTGYGLEWMLAGTHGANGPGSEAAFSRQWRDSTVAPTLAGLGFDSPESLGATFLAGPERLGEVLAGVEPVTDDFPLRLGPRPPAAIDPRYLAFMDAGRAQREFERSALVKRLWPAALRERTFAAFREQGRLNEAMGWQETGRAQDLARLAPLLRESRSRFTALVALRASEAEIAAARRAEARGENGAATAFLRGADLLAGHAWLPAAEALQRAALEPAVVPRAAALHAVALELAGTPQH
jgi:spermidine synthase